MKWQGSAECASDGVESLTEDAAFAQRTGVVQQHETTMYIFIIILFMFLQVQYHKMTKAAAF